MRDSGFHRIFLAWLVVISLVPLFAFAQDADPAGNADDDDGFDWGWLGLLGLLGLLPRRPVGERTTTRETTTASRV